MAYLDDLKRPIRELAEFVSTGDGSDGRSLMTPGALDDADLVTLVKLLTLHVRKERFSGGQLANALEQGWLAAILERLRNVPD